MKIEIEYLLKGKSKWDKKYFTPEEYFDPLDQEDITEGYNINSISKHHFKPSLNVVKNINDVLYLNIIIEQINEKKIERYVFFNDRFYFRELIKYKNNKIEYKQINIMSIFLKPFKIENSIVLKEIDGVYYPLSNSLSPDFNGSEKYESLDFKVFKDLLNNNGNESN